MDHKPRESAPTPAFRVLSVLQFDAGSADPEVRPGLLPKFQKNCTSRRELIPFEVPVKSGDEAWKKQCEPMLKLFA